MSHVVNSVHDGEPGLLPPGATIALLIAALSFFLSRSRHE
jgi:hypothetical protein